MLLKYNVVMVLISVSGQSKISPLLSILQAGHGTGKTLNSIPSLPWQGKYREFYCNMGKFFIKNSTSLSMDEKGTWHDEVQT